MVSNTSCSKSNDTMKISDVMTINIPNASGSFLSLLQSVPGNPHTMLCKLSHEKFTLWHLGILTALDFHCRPQQIPAKS